MREKIGEITEYVQQKFMQAQQLDFNKWSEMLAFLREKKFSHDVNSARQKILLMLNSDKFSPLVQDYLKNINTEGVPFNDFSKEPHQISQIKKIINALYHAELALKDAETGNLFSISMKVNSAIDNTYQACYLVTHFDLNLSDIFSKELAVLAPLYTMFNAFAEEHGREAKTFLSGLGNQDISSKVGLVGGILIDQMKPGGEDADYDFIAKFSAVLPQYLDTLRGYIVGFSARVSEYEPNIQKKDLDELADNANKLLDALHTTRRNNIFLPLKLLQYLHIIRHTITLSTSIINQASFVNESTQVTTRDKLTELKYDLLPSLFGLADKIEEQMMLMPGTLSDPLMRQVSQLYAVLIEYTRKFVNFSVEGQALTSLEDSCFVAARLEQTSKRSVEDRTLLLQIDVVRDAADKFFETLRKGSYNRISDITASPAREKLAEYFKLMMPYVVQINIPLNNAIINGLKSVQPKKSSTRILEAALQQVGYCKDLDLIDNVLGLQVNLNNLLDKISESHKFHINLNDNLITSIIKRVDALRLFQHNSGKNPYYINEANILKAELVATDKRFKKDLPPILNESQITTNESNAAAIQRFEAVASVTDRIIELEHLTKDQKLSLYQFYDMKLEQLKSAKKVYEEFKQFVGESCQPTPLHIKKLRNLYSVIQPYLVSGFLLTSNATIDSLISEIDHGIVAELNTDTPTELANCRRILDYENPIIARFYAAEQRLLDRHSTFERLVKLDVYKESTDKKLVEDSTQTERAHFVIKNTECSREIAELVASLHKLTSKFNSSLVDQLKKADKGLPFPELENFHKKLTISRQSLALKRLFNCLFHLEKISKLLEELNDESNKITYSNSVANIGMHLYDLYIVAKELAATPELPVVAGALWNKLKEAYATVMRVRSHYIPESVAGVTDLTENHSPAIYYTINTLLVSPEHIVCLRDGHHLPQEHIDELHHDAERVTRDIEQILKDSSSSFKLFLSIPKMYSMFTKLKVKLVELSNVTHEVVMDNLGAINTNLLTQMLLEADRWEDSLALQPGEITDTLKKLIDVLYQGFVQPLRLVSQRQVELITTMDPIDQRIRQASNQIQQTKLAQQKIKEKQTLLSFLIHRIKYQLANDDADLELVSITLTNALPILKEIRKEMQHHHSSATSICYDDNQPKDDDLLNAKSGEELRKELTYIEELANLGVSYFQGLLETENITMCVAQQKIEYLTQLKEKQNVLNNEFVERYIKTCFDKKVKELRNKYVRLTYCDEAYKLQLNTYLLSAREDIVSRAKNDENINQKVDEMLRDKYQQFERENYNKYYDLDTIIAATSMLQVYVKGSNKAIEFDNSTFEATYTLEEKYKLVADLLEYSDEPLAIDQKLNKIRNYIREDTFKTKLLAYHHVDGFTIKWLKQCVSLFIEWIGLYVSGRQKCYDLLIKSVEPRPEAAISLSSSGLSLFNTITPRRPYNVSTILENPGAQPSIPAPALA